MITATRRDRPITRLGESGMPAPKPPEFRRRAVELAWLRKSRLGLTEIGRVA
jgi:hypothetical protein